MGFLSAGMQLIGGYFNSKAAHEEGRAQADAAEYQAAVARNNAILAKYAADYATKAGDQNAQARMMVGSQTLEHDKTQYAAGNLDISSGTPNDTIRDVAAITKLDTLTIRNNAARQAWSYLNQSTAFEKDAAFSHKQAGQAIELSHLAAWSAMLGSGASVSSNWMRYSSMSGFGAFPGASPQVQSGGGSFDAGSTGMGNMA